MRNPEQVLNILAEHSNESGYKYERLYRILFNEQMFLVAYQRIHAKPGNMTPGTDGQTEDGMSIDKIHALIDSLKSEVYRPKPAKRVYIPKKSGKLRPLGIPTFADKLVQEVVRMVLEAIYEGYFERTSHGFRPHKSCHTALKSLQNNFNGTKWFIEGDIKGFFDNINHGVMIEILRERISDERFLRLIRKFLNAGYLEEWHFNRTYSGTPQGGIISPILANIYLDKFDKYMKKYAQDFHKGKVRHRNKDIGRLNNRVHYLKKRMKEVTDVDKLEAMREEVRNKQQQILTMPSGNDMDENFRRLNYVRYADDFLIGVIGNKAECEKIKADVTQFMQEKLKLEMSQEKTLITNAQDNAKFLGYEISVRKDYTTQKNARGETRRHRNGNVILHVSREVIKKKLLSLEAMNVKTRNGKEVWSSKGRTYLIDNEPQDIVARFNTEIRGFYNYYSIANNVSYAASKFGYIMEYSMYHTIAAKTNSSISKVIDKYKKGNDIIVPYHDAKGKLRYRVFYNEGFKRKLPSSFADVDNIPYIITVPQPTLVERLKSEVCELCGKVGPVVMHHARNLNHLKGDTEWEKLMLAKHRKTLVVCTSCNAKIQSHAG